MKRRTLAAGLAAGLTAAGVFAWTRPTPEARAEVLLEEQVSLWVDPAARADSVALLRASNPEWDFMRRTFLALALVDRALARPEEADRWLVVVDDLLASIREEEALYGQRTFLLPYADQAPFRDPAGRSLFVDGEIALVAGARRFVRDDPELARFHQDRVAAIDRAFAASPAGLPESYPDEAWLFCVTNALVALKMGDALDGTDHSGRITAWTDLARERLREPATGMLGSSYTWSGRPLDGPEGSSVWLVATNLQLLDKALADEQYALAREALVRGVGGFAWAAEWGPGWRGPQDVDSGPVVPILDASPSSSGFALLAARAFGDDETHARLVRSLGAADLVVPVLMPGLGGHPMGDTIVLHGLTFGPLWDEIRRRAEPTG